MIGWRLLSGQCHPGVVEMSSWLYRTVSCHIIISPVIVILSYHGRRNICNERPLSPSLSREPDSRSPENSLPSDAIHIGAG